MKPGLGVAVCVGFALWSAASQAETFYKYRDPTTRRDVFVNSLDQIPRKYRGQAKIAMELPDVPTEVASDQASGRDSSATEAAPTRTIAEPLRQAGVDLRQATVGKNLLKDGPAIAAALVNAKLVKSGTNPLTDPERARLGRIDILAEIGLSFRFFGGVTAKITLVRLSFSLSSKAWLTGVTCQSSGTLRLTVPLIGPVRSLTCTFISLGLLLGKT